MKRALLTMSLFATLFGCTNRSDGPPPTIANDDEHNAIYERGTGLISSHMELLGRQANFTKKAKKEVAAGIRDLDAVTDYAPDNWAAFWFKGKGYQVLKEHEAANREFKRAFELQQQNPDVAREYAASCLELGLGAEAVRVTRHAVTLNPSDAGLYANLALALLINGENTDAKAAIEKALEMAPDDEISLAVQDTIRDVIAGRRRQPKSMADLN